MNANEILSHLQQIRNDIQTSRQEAKTNTDKLMQETMTLAAELKIFNQRFEHLENRVETIGYQQEFVFSELDDVKCELNSVRQKQLELNLRFTNLPEVDGETNAQTLELIQTILKHLDVDPLTSVTSVKRLGKKHGNNPRPILVVMSSKLHRDAVLSAKRKKRLTLDRFYKNAAPNTNIFIDEFLTRENGHLYKLARDLGKSTDSKFVWVKDGTVYIKQREGTAAHPIRREADLQIYGTTGKKRRNDDTGSINQQQQIAKLRKGQSQPPQNHASCISQNTAQRLTRSTAAAAAASATTHSSIIAPSTLIVISDDNTTSTGIGNAVNTCNEGSSVNAVYNNNGISNGNWADSSARMDSQH